MSYTRACLQPSPRWYLSGLVLLLLTRWSQALTVSYCSPDNAGADETESNYMSNGFCQDHCQGSYVFAIIQGQNCWCSNEQPANTVSNSQCSDQCPGYPSETCGNVDQGLFAYFNLGGNPTGTYGGSSPSSSASSSSPDSTTTADNTQTQVYTSIVSVTGSGRVSTIVVTPTPAQTTDSALGASSQQPSTGHSSGLSGGAVAGIVIGVAIIIGLIIGGIVFFILRKRHRRDLDAMSEGASHTSPARNGRNTGGIPSRQVSQMSSAGLLTRPTRMNTTGGLSSQGEDHRSTNNTLNSDRASTHMTVDQRLNPWAIYSNEDSRASNVSLQDNQDYSRQLRVANPDP